MDTNSFILYGAVTEIYDKLIRFCRVNGFKVKETKEKYFSITAKKTSLLFWRSLQMELKVMAVEKKNVEVNIMMYKFGKRKMDIETEYRIALEKFFSNSQ
ncbi:MAG: hypothetical protein V4685_08060 [Bacteroidota bacterium]